MLAASPFCGRRCCPAVSAPRPLAAPPSVAPLAAPSAVVAQGRYGPWKKWRKLPLNKNGNWVRSPMHVRRGDMVVVIAGKDKGAVGPIIKVDRKYKRVMLEGVNKVLRNIKAETDEATGDVIREGEQVREEAYIHASNVMHWSEERQVRSRVGHKWINGRKVRYLKKTGEIVDTEERLQREREEYIAARNARPGDEDEEEGGTGAAAGSIEGDTDASEDETSDESDPESNPGVTGTVASEGEQGKGGKK